MKIKIAGIVPESVVDGPGLRYVVFVQGCPHRCMGCHNPKTHSFAHGKWMDTGEIIKEFSENPLLDGITLSGGEPFSQAAACMELAKAAKERGMTVWAYSGYTFENLMEDEEKAALVKMCDVLVDGPFVLAERSLDLEWRGSRNQRVIDVSKFLEKEDAEYGNNA